MTLGLSIKGVSKTWNPGGPGAVPAVRNLNLEVAIGEFVVLLGPSGCGRGLAALHHRRARGRDRGRGDLRPARHRALAATQPDL
ncbi:MAG: hypothetical protein R3D59_06660 [Paracoccaceae bacterium]